MDTAGRHNAGNKTNTLIRHGTFRQKANQTNTEDRRKERKGQDKGQNYKRKQHKKIT